MQEIWKDIKNYEGLYQVSNFGNVKSLDRYVAYSNTRVLHRKSVLLKPTYNHKGYKIIILCKNNKLKGFQIHRLVAEAFIQNKENKTQVNHIDGNKLNNNVDNLEWVTPHENMLHAYKNSLIKKEDIKKCVNASIEKRKKPVLQIENGIVIREFDKVIDVAIFYNLKSTKSLTDVLKGRRSKYLGYNWKYKEKGI